jgi:2-succinyl-5-enolpyruvyl-6-hydroxy-3-cyclohexene-1-carboxylate synthase
MTAPNWNTLWARTLVEELVAGGVRSVVISPGSRSTPLTVAFARHPDVRIYSQLDERSAAYFALGRARRTGRVTPLVCTSGTAAANYYPAVIEASQARVPLVLLTADRPPELRDSGANQTIDQEKLYGDRVRWYRDLPEPEPDARKLRSLRTIAARALSDATGVPSGPVHLNVPFRKPLEPVAVEGDVPTDPDSDAISQPESSGAGDGAAVSTTQGAPELDDRELSQLAEALSVERGLIVAGPADPPGVDAESIAALAHASGFPIVADPLSGLRFGSHVRTTTVLGGYDAYLQESLTADWPDPDVVLRIGASPTSKPLRKYLARVEARQLLVDPAGAWREAEFTATDLVTADPSRLARRLARTVRTQADPDWQQRWERAERAQWEVLDDAREDGESFEGRLLAAVAEQTPEPATIFVSNSMPVRDLDRFARPQPKGYTVLGNRGASGIDGITSTALGAGSAAAEHLTLVTGDLAYYHDMNGLLALERCAVDATIVLINNDGGGIFHMLPIESFDPPFTDQFKTPHGLDFEPTGDLYGLTFERAGIEQFSETYAEAVTTEGTTVIEVQTDAEQSHRIRERLRERVRDRIRESQ